MNAHEQELRRVIASLEDEYKPINGMRYFLSSLFASNIIWIGADISSEANENANIQNNMISETIEILKHILEHFRRVEAIYKVKVLSEQSTSATDQTFLHRDNIVTHNQSLGLWT